METTEHIESINRQLREQFGIDSEGFEQIWRVVWSEKQFEKRLGDYVDFDNNGNKIREVTEVREVPKYRQWIRERYVLERLVLVPNINITELLGKMKSYEPIWVFSDHDGNYLPPKFEVCKFVIDTVYAAMSQRGGGMRKYIDEDAQNPIERRNERVRKIERELFGNETPTTDALAYKTGVVVPHPQKTEN